VREATEVHRRTETRDAMRAIRARLDPLDRELLILRVEQGLPCTDEAGRLLRVTMAGQASLVATGLTRPTRSRLPLFTSVTKALAPSAASARDRRPDR